MAAYPLTAETEALLHYQSRTIGPELLHRPGPDFIDRCFVPGSRPPQVLRALGALYGHGRLAGTGYLSILPVDQGIEHTAGASFGANPQYFDPDNILKLAVEGGCNAVATTFGTFEAVARRYAHKIPFVVKINHNELLTYPNKFDQIPFGSVRQAWDLGATAVGATIYFGSEESDRQLVQVAAAFEEAHRLGLATVLWCYLPSNAFQTSAADYHLAADRAAVVRAAIIIKRAGGQGLIVGRKAFQRPMADGVALLHAIQDVYLDAAVGLA